jgi:hypothetical protein
MHFAILLLYVWLKFIGVWQSNINNECSIICFIHNYNIRSSCNDSFITLSVKMVRF